MQTAGREAELPYVIAEPCIGVKDRGCVSVCPCDCIEEGTLDKDGRVYDMLFIEPDHCIDCGLCEAECPVGAIFADSDLPAEWKHYAEFNAEYHRGGAADRVTRRS